MIRKLTFFILSLLLLGSSTYSNVAFSQNWQVGTRSITFTDPDRSNRTIPCDVYYPAATSGQNVPMAEGEFPHIVFGHGFVMNVAAYSSIADALAQSGFIVLLPSTETGFSPSHTQFARDLAFVADEVINKGGSPGDFFFEQVSGRFAIGGHSMGGGCTYLSVQYLNNSASCLFTFAAAETNPSAIAQMPGLATPNLMLAGELDCVTPPEDHQILMFDAQTGDDCKYYVELEGGYHCHFNDFNFNCNLGESFCSPPGGLTRAAQIELVLEIITPWLKSFLFQDCVSWLDFLELVEEEDGTSVEFDCQIEFPTQPGIMINGNQPACPGDMVILEAIETDGDILWNTGENSLEIEVTEPGSYFYSLSSAVCLVESESVEIVFQADPGYSIVSSAGNELCPGESLELFASPDEGDFIWNTGAGGSSIIVSEEGAYSFLAMINGCWFNSDEFLLTTIADPNLQVVAPQGTVLCPEESIFLEVSDFSLQALWNVGLSQPVIEVYEGGVYFYEAFVGNCLFTSDSIEVIVEEKQEAEILVIGDTILCPGESLMMVALTGEEILWSTNETTDTIVVTIEGNYNFRIFTEYCVFESEVIRVNIKEEKDLEVLLENGPFFCPGDSAILQTNFSAVEILWNTGSEDSIIVVTESGEYFYSILDDGCSFFSDTLFITFSEDPGFTVLLDNGLELCEGDSLILKPSVVGLEVFWSSGIISDSLTVHEAGAYFYTVGDSSCLFVSDTLNVELISRPEYQLVSDEPTDNCPGDSVLVKVEVDEAAVIWNGDEVSDSLWIFDSGIFFFDLLVDNCQFHGEEFEVQFRGSWDIDSIEGIDTVKKGETYIYSVDFYDFLIYNWEAFDAEIVSGAFTNQIELFIPEEMEDKIELNLYISDRICSEKSISKELFVESTVSSTHLFEEISYTLLDASNLWLLRFSSQIVDPKFKIMDTGGRLIKVTNFETDSEFRILKDGLPKGLLFLKVESKYQQIPAIKLISL